MIVDNTRENRQVQSVATTMALENMALDKDYALQLIKVSCGEVSSEDLRKKVTEKYAR